MDSISHRYYKHSKTFLSIISLWPCDKRWSKRILRIFICLLLASGTVVQLTTCVTSTCTGDVLLKLLPYVIVTIIFFLKYVTICFKIETIVHTFDQMENNWHTVKDEQEIKILEKYSELSRFFSLGFANIAHRGTQYLHLRSTCY
ncbi:hypothetical protein KM043_002519 [Ampulex compressa]|nr:hypothetical protein KM043_002519 [Ampulex compressa]